MKYFNADHSLAQFAQCADMLRGSKFEYVVFRKYRGLKYKTAHMSVLFRV